MASLCGDYRELVGGVTMTLHDYLLEMNQISKEFPASKRWITLPSKFVQEAYMR